jgi:hypothetical protein
MRRTTSAFCDIASPSIPSLVEDRDRHQTIDRSTEDPSATALRSSFDYAVLTIRDGELRRCREFYDERAARLAAGLAN